MRALKREGFTIKWFDKRKTLEELDFEPLTGFILNQERTGFLTSLLTSRHWIALPQIDGVFYNSNSNLRQPKAFEDRQQVSSIRLPKDP